MNKFYRLLSMAACILISDHIYVDDTDHTMRKFILNNLPITIFTPQTQQFVAAGGSVTQESITGPTGPSGSTGPTGATGATGPKESAFGRLRRTLTGMGDTPLSIGQTATFDATGMEISHNVTYNPANSPSLAIPAQSVTANLAGYYVIDFSYVGSQATTSYTGSDFYATFNFYLDGLLLETFTLSTLGLRQGWSCIKFLDVGSTISFKAASPISFLSTSTPNAPIDSIDSFILNLYWIGDGQTIG